MASEDLFEARLQRFQELELQLSDPAIVQDQQKMRTIAQEHARLKPWVDLCLEWKQTASHLQQSQEILQSETDEEMRELATSELEELQEKTEALRQQLEQMLLDDDPEDDKNVIMEIRAGTGGDEAGLFAADLYRMYTRYASDQGWSVEDLGMNATELGGIKEVVLGIEGAGVYGQLKFESGVHRVQRVPATEASGRIHTSTVTVAVLPQAEDVDIEVDAKDLKIDVYRSSGPGGQGVNTTDSAVRITHIPTGVVVTCQDERSQIKNKAKAMKVLRARLLETQQEAQASERDQDRRSQIGTGERSEKIRTYNFPDRRITDHRIGLTSHQLEGVLEGDLAEFVEGLRDAERERKLQQNT